jgi:putative restriction endonuclease
MALTPSELGRRLVDALAAATDAVTVETDLRRRPLLLSIQAGATSSALRVFAWRIEHGGATRSPSEYRVQATRPRAQPFLVDDGRRTLLLGHHERLDVFAAWDVRVHPNPGRSSSLQVSLETLEEAHETGFASRARETSAARELVMAFRPDAIRTYLEVLTQIDVAGMDSATPAVEMATSGEPAAAAEIVEQGPRRRALVEIALLVRDRRFRTYVLRAYEEHCAFCGLGLGLVQAAHIQAVIDGGPDVISNGLAACPNHHLAFDRGLLLVENDGRISFNEELAVRLGLDPRDRKQFREGLRDRAILPADPAMRPDQDRLELHRQKAASQTPPHRQSVSPAAPPPAPRQRPGSPAGR